VILHTIEVVRARQLGLLLVGLGAPLAAVTAIDGSVGTAQSTGQLVVEVLCPDGAIGTFDVTLARDGVVVGVPQSVQCTMPRFGGEVTFDGLTHGSYTITETAALGTDLSNYRTFATCADELRPGTVVLVEIGDGSTRCRFVNQLARSGKLEVRSECRGRSTTGRFRVELDGTGEAVEIPCDGIALFLLPPGSYDLTQTPVAGSPVPVVTLSICRTGSSGPVAVGRATVQDVVVAVDEHTTCRMINVMRSR
jgi:hypothetical protein